MVGLDRVMGAGLMESIEWFFNLVCQLDTMLRGSPRLGGSELICQHDKDKDGFLTKDEVIQLSESLLVRGLQLADRLDRY